MGLSTSPQGPSPVGSSASWSARSCREEMERMREPQFCCTPVCLTLLWGVLWAWMRRPLSRADGAEYVRAPAWCQPSPGGFRGDRGGGSLFWAPGWSRARSGAGLGQGQQRFYGHLSIFTARMAQADISPVSASFSCPALSGHQPRLCPSRDMPLSLNSMRPASVSPPGSGALLAVGGDPTQVLSHGAGLPRDPDVKTQACNAAATRRPEVLTRHFPAGLGQPGHQPPESRHRVWGPHMPHCHHDPGAHRLGTV